MPENANQANLRNELKKHFFRKDVRIKAEKYM